MYNSKFKKGDYITVMSKQSGIHINRIFGTDIKNADDFEASEYLGRIKTVIDDSTYLIITLKPLDGFYCIEDDSMISKV